MLVNIKEESGNAQKFSELGGGMKNMLMIKKLIQLFQNNVKSFYWSFFFIHREKVRVEFIATPIFHLCLWSSISQLNSKKR